MAIRRGLGFDGACSPLLLPMFRLMLRGSILLVIGLSFRNGWVIVNWNKFFTDINLPFLAEPEPAKKFQFKSQ
jgi:hypothetical protein